jgi:dUTP pyrophosphatase
LRIQAKRLDPTLPLPAYAHEGDAGLDLYSAIDVTLKPGERAAVSTGLAVAIPEGHAGLVQPRSGLARKKGLGVVNSPGLVDSGYRGEITVVLINLDPEEPIIIERGARIAQLVVVPVESVELVEVDELPESSRGASGFGSTG